MAIPTTIESLSTTAASNGPSGSEQRTLADDGLRQAYAFIAMLVNAGSDIASGTTITPPSTGSSFHITGTTAITTIASTNSWNGREIVLIFDGALTFTHGSNLALPGSVNITTAANDVAVMRQNSSGAWRCISYQRADGSFIGSSYTATGSTIPANGLYLSAANTPALSSNTTLRWSVNSTGTHVFAEPSGGITVAVTASRGALHSAYESPQGISHRLATVAGGYGSWTIYDDTSGGFGIWSIGHLPGANTFSIGTGDAIAGTLTSAITISSTRNVTIQAPSSGVALTATGVAGADTVNINGGTSGSFRVNETGVPYGTSLHNNAGSVTGTTNQYIASGTYTPTLTNVANIAASTAYKSQWLRVGNVVTVSGTVDIDPTVATTSTSLGIALPIASNFTTPLDASGTSVRQTAAVVQLCANINADSTNDRVNLFFYNDADVANRAWNYIFTYEVL